MTNPVIALHPAGPRRGPGAPGTIVRGMQASLTELVGREQERAALAIALSRSRLVTLLGPGGVGKTRLAQEVAATEAPRFDGRAWWVDLTAIDDGAEVPRLVAAALGVRPGPGRDYQSAAVAALCAGKSLLVLDNCEHVAEGVSRFAGALLRDAPGLVILATSREVLGVEGEVLRAVPPLAAPEPRGEPSVEEVGRADGVRLFVERARDASPSFALTSENAADVARIVRQAGGLPLAIELAAARVPSLSPRQIAQRLDDAVALLTRGRREAPARHRTLEALLDWGDALLAAHERALFRRLGVFRGGFTLEAAEAVGAGGEVPAERVVDLLADLVSKSLVEVAEVAGEARYRLLEPIRQYAASHLEELRAEDDPWRRHAEYYTRLAERIAPGLRSPARPRAIEHLEREHDNLRAALECSVADDRGAERALRLAGALVWFWMMAGHWAEGRRWLERVLALPGAAGHARAYAIALHGAGLTAWLAGDLEAALVRQAEAERALRALGEPLPLALLLDNAAQTRMSARDLDGALPAAEEAVALARAAGERWDIAQTVLGLGAVRHARGDHKPARAAYEEAEAIWRSLGDAWGQSVALHSLSVLAWQQRALDTAAALAVRSLFALREEPDHWFAARALESLAAVECGRGALPRAAKLLGAADAQRAAGGATLLPFERGQHDGSVAAVRATLGEVEASRLVREGRAMTWAELLEMAGSERTARPSARTPMYGGPVFVEPAVALRVRALGPLEVERADGTAVSFPYAKPRELLGYLLAHSPSTKEQIGLALWPEASAAQLRNVFHVTLHHLRRSLGDPAWITAKGGRYAFDRSLGVWYDAAEMEAAVAAARRAERDHGGEERAIDALRQGLALARGDFLEGSAAGDWAVAEGGRLRALVVDGWVLMGRLLSAIGRNEEAMEAFRTALGKDNLREDAHRELMRCLARTGERAQALRHYKLLAMLLRGEVGAEPSPETRALHDRLTRGDMV